MCEILAPAGGYESAIAAISAGADAIYLGLKDFSARSSAENFDGESFSEIAKIARAYGVKVYVAQNTMIKDCEKEEFIRSAVNAHNSGADAIILSDIYLGALLKRKYPEIVLHLSTQAGVCNVLGAKMAKELGFSRVILARETALDDIKAIAEIIETEVFVQGALCTCFSGQCYLSSFAGGNSGNRGKCKQPCRKLYSIERDGFSDLSYKFSLSDLSVGADIKKLRDAGVSSFKIEGRMRRPEYVAAAVKYCKNCLKNGENSEYFSDLKRTYNRGNYTRGLAFGQDRSFISSAVQGHIGEFVGLVKVENGRYKLTAKGRFLSGDGFKILRDGREVGGAVYAGDCAGGCLLKSETRLKNGDKVFITTDSALNSALLSAKREIEITVNAQFICGEVAKIDINGERFYGEKPLDAAKSHALSADEIKNCFEKVDKYPYKTTFGRIETDGVFVPKSELNALRRRAYDGYFEKISQNNNPAAQQKSIDFPRPDGRKNAKTAVICPDFRGITADIGILKPDDYGDIPEPCRDFAGEKFLYLPPFMTGDEIERVKGLFTPFDGIYCDGLYGMELARETGKKFFAGTGFNIANGVQVASCNVDYIALSKELTVKEAAAISAHNTFYLAAGDLKVMDLVYCPFERKCKTCDRRTCYRVKDGDGREFTLRRYKVSECRFELYNGARLAAGGAGTGILLDCSLGGDVEGLCKAAGDREELTAIIGGNYTRGHAVVAVK